MTITAHIVDLDEAIALFDQAIAEKGPDYIYPRAVGRPSGGCVYFEQAGIGADTCANVWVPSCAVGHVVHKLGVERDDIISGDFEDWSTGRTDFNFAHGAAALVDFLQTMYGLQFTNQAEQFLAYVQEHQDNGMPWEWAKFTALYDMTLFDRVPNEWVYKIENETWRTDDEEEV